MTQSVKPSITAHDLLKTFAVIIMIIDHMGHYFFPEVTWWRAIGRVGFPIWFYLIGHASGREISPRLMGGALLLLAMNFVVGIPMFPLNALCTIIVVRLILNYVMAPVEKNFAWLWVIFVLCIPLSIPSRDFTEYGTLALVFAMFGYMVRRHQDGLGFTKNQIRDFMIAVSVFFLGVQYLFIPFSTIEFVVMSLGTIAVCIYLCDFKSASYPKLDILPGIVKSTMRLCGRYTLEIYVLHLMLFKILALYLGTRPELALFNFHMY